MKKGRKRREAMKGFLNLARKKKKKKKDNKKDKD